MPYAAGSAYQSHHFARGMPYAAPGAYTGASHFAFAPGAVTQVAPYASPRYATIPAFPGSSQAGVEALSRAYQDAERRVQERDFQLLQVQGALASLLGYQQPHRPYGP